MSAVLPRINENEAARNRRELRASGPVATASGSVTSLHAVLVQPRVDPPAEDVTEGEIKRQAQKRRSDGSNGHGPVSKPLRPNRDSQRKTNSSTMAFTVGFLRCRVQRETTVLYCTVHLKNKSNLP